MTSELIEQLENALHISEGKDFNIRADFVREIIAALREPEAQAVAVMHHESTGWVQWLENPRTIPDRAALYVSSPAPSVYVMVPIETLLRWRHSVGIEIDPFLPELERLKLGIKPAPAAPRRMVMVERAFLEQMLWRYDALMQDKGASVWRMDLEMQSLRRRLAAVEEGK